MGKIIIFDFEVFAHDTLFGAYILTENSKELFQTWNLSTIKEFYINHKNDIWVGHNIKHYDNFILQGIIENKTEEELKIINDNIIVRDIKYKFYLPLNFYDLIENHFVGLKVVEAVVGKNISETEVDFNLNRKLSTDEKLLTNSYNKDDLDQTYDDFIYLKDEFQLRLEIIKEFKLDLSCLSLTGTQIAEKVLHSNRIHGIEFQRIAPKIYDTLQLKNQQVINYYLQERFKSEEKLDVVLCGVKHKLGRGGIHGAQENVSADEVLYLDVSGYYNLIMLNYDLLPRTINQEGRELYEYMYHQQLELKKYPELAMKRGVYKTILLSVFGAMNNKYCNFYDPYKGDLVTITGQIFIVDLLEKLEGKINLFQSNTDGIMVQPTNGYTEEDILAIVKEWCNRTHFVIKPKKIYNLIQRDVNNYIYVDEDGEITARGEAVKHSPCADNPFETNSYDSKEATIISKAIVEYLVHNIPVEQTIEENKNNLRLFQFVCKKNSYDWLEYEENSILEVHSTKLQGVNRVFAFKDREKLGMIYKYKVRDGKTSKAKIANLPVSVFVYNDEILSNKAIKEVSEKIDYNYYIKRACEKILDFI